MTDRCTACTSRSPARHRCGTSPTARWRAASWPRTWCPRRWAGTSCPTPSFATGRPAAACCSCGWTSPATPRTRTSELRGAAPDLVDLLPAGHIPPGFLPVLQAYDYAGDEVTLVHADDVRLRRMAVFDVLINNADRKGGHILSGVDGQRVRRRPRREPARRGQAAHRAVGLGGQARRRRRPWRPSRRCATSCAATSATVARAHHRSRGRRAAAPEPLRCWTIR